MNDGNKEPKVKVDLDIPGNIEIKPRVKTTGLFNQTVVKKRTFAQVIAPLAAIKVNLKSFIAEMSTGVRDNKIEIAQIEKEIADDIGEIEEAEGSLEFIEQVIAATKKKK